jgi:2',3'-cyclic-nucleotide 2'-phosphodiesterase (5'-nucleotidase family)
MNLDFAFQNEGGIRTSDIPQGAITYNDVYKLDPFGNLVIIYSMNLKEIKSLIANSYNRNKAVDLEISGMTCTIRTDASGNCTDVMILDTSGKQLPAGKEYSVGMNSYVAASYKFDHRDPGTASSLTTAQTLLGYLLEVHNVNYKGTKRVAVEAEPGK